MKAIFLVKDKLNINEINQVYGHEIERLPEMMAMEIFTEKDVRSNISKFSDVQFIFSTWYMPCFKEEEVRQVFPKLEIIFYAAGTVKYFAEPFLKCGVRIFSAATANALPVAEFVTAQIILANKGYYQAQQECKKPFYKLSYSSAREITENKPGNYKSNVGIIGAGNIGRNVIKLLASYSLNVFAYDPFVSSENLSSLGAKKVELNTLFSECDVITNHLPDVDDTVAMLNYDCFSLMKSNATFINTGRGRQVVEKDLIRALKEHKERCALLDVYSHEPLFPWSPLFRMPNVFLTPHIAGSISSEKLRLGSYMVDAFCEIKDKGIASQFEVTLDMLYRMT